MIDGRYQVRSMIARGGMATVYVATDLRLERRVAIKIMHDHLAADDAFRARFIQEARAAAKLAHPNVVNVYDQGEDRGLAYIVMEYVPGITLRDLLHDHHRLTPEQTIDVMDAVLAGLQAAHKIGIVHRDLKPENVLLADDGRIKLSDFGLARAASANTASGQVLLGTIAYLSPELVTQGTADIRSDIYSLGIMMYEMLTGEQPYSGDQPVNIAFRHANEDVPAPSRIREGVPSQLDDLVLWATERDPEARPADAGAMLVALRQAEQELAAAGGVPTAPLDSRLAVAPTGVERDQLVVSSDDGTEVGYGYTPNDAVTERDLDPITTLFDEPVNYAAADQVQPMYTGQGELSPVGTTTKRRAKWPIIVSILSVLFLIGAVGGWWLLLGPGSYKTTPDVVGMDQAAAEQQIQAQGFVVGNVTEEFSLEVAKGTVMKMDPGPGQSLAPETPISLTVSAGPENLTVPALQGLARDTAIKTITESRFRYDEGTDLKEFSSQPKDTVIRATDESGQQLPTQMAEQSPIRLVISLGPVPDVLGKTLDEATKTLEGAGLKVQSSGEEFSDTVPAGHIISASNSANPMKQGDTVNVVVSKGQDLVQVPNVVGKTTKDAVKALEDAGFEVQHNVPASFIEKTKVTSQNPGANTKQPRGSKITLQSSLEF